MMDAIFSMTCGSEQGTAFATDRGYISAAHVATSGHCRAARAVLGRVSTDRPRDVAIMRSSEVRPVMRASCAGIVAGQEYTITGYPRRVEGQVTVTVVATGDRHDVSGFVGLASFRGSIVKGMSGGPIMNAQGEVVAVATATSGPFVLGQPLSDTEICRSN